MEESGGNPPALLSTQLMVCLQRCLCVFRGRGTTLEPGCTFISAGVPGKRTFHDTDGSVPSYRSINPESAYTLRTIRRASEVGLEPDLARFWVFHFPAVEPQQGMYLQCPYVLNGDNNNNNQNISSTYMSQVLYDSHWTWEEGRGPHVPAPPTLNLPLPSLWALPWNSRTLLERRGRSG